MKRAPLKVGFDFDGVIAYFPLRIVRAPISYVKKHIFGIRKLSFFYPKTALERWIWVLLHDTSTFPARGVDLLKQAVESGEIEAHIVTARYSFLDTHLDRWLDRHGLKGYFKTINLNTKDQQPHLFKEAMIKEMKFDYFIEDNIDIVEYLAKKNMTRVFWIYNILDRRYGYPDKFPYVEKAIQALLSERRSGRP